MEIGLSFTINRTIVVTVVVTVIICAIVAFHPSCEQTECDYRAYDDSYYDRNNNCPVYRETKTDFHCSSSFLSAVVGIPVLSPNLLLEHISHRYVRSSDIDDADLIQHRRT